MLSALKFKNLPYLNFFKGPSTTYKESIHVENVANGKTLSFFYCKIRKTINVSLHDANEKNARKRTNNVVDNVKQLSQHKVNSLFEEHLI